jgi:hypothetical protein
MAMNEDSVVSSLNELRRMANERSRREAEARARLEAERRAWEDRNRSGRHGETRSRPADARQDPKTNTMTYGFPEATIQVEGYGAVGQWQPPAAQAQTLAVAPAPHQSAPHQLVEPQTARLTQAEWAAGHDPAAPGPQAGRSRSSVGPVLVTVVLMGIAGAAGYFKLQKDWEATLRAHAGAITRLEEAKGQAIEAAGRADAQAKLQAANYEHQIKMLTARASLPAAPPEGTAPPSAMVRTGEPSKVGSGGQSGRWASGASRSTAKSRRWWRSHAGAAGRRGAGAAAAGAAAEDKKPALPTIARKKKVKDDPLDGLKL